MQLFNWLFKNKKLQKDIRKEEALKIYEEVRELIEIYHKQLLKGRSYSQDVCNRLRDLFEFRLEVEYKFYKSNSEKSIPFQDADETFNIIVRKVNQAFSK